MGPRIHIMTDPTLETQQMSTPWWRSVTKSHSHRGGEDRPKTREEVQPRCFGLLSMFSRLRLRMPFLSFALLFAFSRAELGRGFFALD